MNMSFEFQKEYEILARSNMVTDLTVLQTALANLLSDELAELKSNVVQSDLLTIYSDAVYLSCGQALASCFPLADERVLSLLEAVSFYVSTLQVESVKNVSRDNLRGIQGQFEEIIADYAS
jgi:hypothetical protein